MSGESSILSLASRLEIESLCAEYEELRGENSLTLLSQLLDSISDKQLRRQALMSLLEIELEYRIRGLSSPAEKCLTGDFASLFLTHHADDLLPDIVELEFVAHQRWGRTVGLPQFLHWANELLPDDSGLENRLYRALLNLRPATVVVYRDREERIDSPLDQPLIVGRQNTWEPKPYCRVESEQGPARIIICPMAERFVSRNQILIERCTKSLFQTTNLGKVAIGINRQKELPSTDSLQTEGDTLIEFHDIVVRIELAVNHS